MAASTTAAVVTGAGRGIGRAIAVELAEQGFGVALQSRSEVELAEVVAQISRSGGRAVAVPGDVTRPEAARALVEAAESAFGRLYVAVAAAGQALSAPLGRTTAEMMRQLFEVNTMGAFHLIQAAASVMAAKKTPGRIIAVGSTASVAGMRYTTAYAASKHALLGLVRSAALELAPRGITVNAVCPGWVNTPMFDATLQNISEKTGATLSEARARIVEKIPMGMLATPEEVAGQVAYLASPLARHVTGQALVLDGGETLG